MGIGIGGAAFLGALFGLGSSAATAYHTGGDPISAGLKGGLIGGAGGAAGGAVAGLPLIGSSAGTASLPSLGAAGAMSAGSSVPAAAGQTLVGGLGSAFLEGAGTGLAAPTSGIAAAPGVTAPVASTTFPWQQLINPAIKVGGQVASMLMQPDAPEYPAPIAPPLLVKDDPTELKLWEESPAAKDERIERERRADEMNRRARAMAELSQTSRIHGSRALAGKTFDEYFQKPRTAKERFLGVSPTIGAARH